MSENMGQPIVVDNRPGGNTLVATEALVRAAPDGYTLLMQTNNLSANPTLYKGKISFDTLKDSRRSRWSRAIRTCSSSIPRCRRAT
jgi:tripartite-type tricarboxylate transporter receptor subunit TctC